MKVIAWFISPRFLQPLLISLCSAVILGTSFNAHRVDTGDETEIHERDVIPTAIATADFDEDGVPDVVCAYADGQGAVLTIHRGNLDSIVPYSLEAKQRRAEGKLTESPFLPEGAAVSLPKRTDYLGAGDFDADGHWDLITAEYRSNVLNYLRGDGRGKFIELKQISLEGKVTSLATGEVNRADGLVDLAVGVHNAQGSAVLIFEAPEGALSAQPEVFPLPAEARELVIGQLDDEANMDLAVAADSSLLIIHGRDRKRARDISEQNKVSPALTSVYSFESNIISIALGSFTSERQKEIAALLGNGEVQVVDTSTRDRKQTILIPDDWDGLAHLVRAKISSLPYDDLVLVGSTKRRIHILSGAKLKRSPEQVATSFDIGGEPAAALPMRLNGDALDDLVVLIKGQSGPSFVMTLPALILEVNSVGDGDDCDLSDGVCSTGTVSPDTGKCVLTGECTLRAAIQQANHNTGADTISFSIGSGVRTITPSFPLPTIISPVTIDGTTQPGFAGSPIIQLNGSNAGAGVSGLTITAGSSLITGLVINRFDINGIDLLINGGNTVRGNYIGTAVNGTTALGNGQSAVFVSTSNNLIGGTTVAERNILSGNSERGISIIGSNGDDNTVQGNYIGTAVNGTLRMGNVNGVVIGSGASNNRIGGTLAGSRNVISGNVNDGIVIVDDNTRANLVQGNYIGTDATGTGDLGNGMAGVRLSARSNTLGGSSVAARNVVSGNDGIGIWIRESFARDNLIQGNYVGTDATGTTSLGNELSGITISTGASNNNIGGTTAAVRNIISSNGHGVVITESGTSGNVVEGNYVGADVTGHVDLGNSQMGVFIANSAGNNIVGGMSTGARNIISGNDRDGIHINNNATTNIVRGNYIGTDVNGTIDLGNNRNGITVDVAPNNTIGGTAAGARNVISGNGMSGIQINGITATGNQVQGNLIGARADGTGALPNGGPGVFISTFASNNAIGGRTDGAGNTIRDNGSNGVLVVSGTGNSIVRNSIFANAGLGIDLAGTGQNGPTANDPGDDDSGANNLQNFPDLTAVVVSFADDRTTIRGTLDSKSGTIFTLDFYSNEGCDLLGFGEGQIFLHSATVTRGDFEIDLPFGVARTQVVTVTATDDANNTSEFSKCAATSAEMDLDVQNTFRGSVGFTIPITWHPRAIINSGLGKVTANQQRNHQLPVLDETETIKIELSRDGGVTFETLFASTPNDGSECWLVTGPPTTEALIRLSNTENAVVRGISVRPFEIVNSTNTGVLIPIDVGLRFCEDLRSADGRSPIRGSSFFADRYSFFGMAGQQVAITVSSTVFDTYLYLIGPNGSVIAQDDNGGGASTSPASSKRGFMAELGSATDSRIPAVSGFLSLPASGIYTIEVTSVTANAAGNYQIRLDGGPVLLAAEGSERGIALDSVTMMREPFPLVAPLKFSEDQRTRIMLFVLHADLLSGEDESVVTAQAEDSQQRTISLPVEFVGTVPGFNWLTQINVRLPDAPASQDTLLVSVAMRGSVSNKVLIKLASPTGSP